MPNTNKIDSVTMPTEFIGGSTVRTMQPTMNLRVIESDIKTVFSDPFTPTPVKHVLQQEWIDMKDGKQEWRDIPVFKEKDIK